jgi:hypothetical protein
MWVLIYWIMMSDGRGNAAATGQVQFATFAACERARSQLAVAQIRSTCVEHD